MLTWILAVVPATPLIDPGSIAGSAMRNMPASPNM